ncbi:Ribosomal protein L34e superfamily protein [Forsythia ovata]|uniref:Ribosomal protein L34e superfamily protein n=1 Tax=Forsythia ovata TaxID=205694 RepID=A0ABD1RGY7_9LAMI
MRLPMVDCRSLIEFCRAFEQHKNSFNSNSNSNSLSVSRTKRHHHDFSNSLNPYSHQFCNRSPLAVLDVIILLIVIGSLGFLFVPYFKLVFYEGLPMLFDIMIDVIVNAPVAYFMGLIFVLVGAIFIGVVWEIIDMRSRKCGNPYCKGLRRAVEYDIQLESEECVKYLPATDAHDNDNGVNQLELGQDRKELEAELKRMAPLNGRTVLIFRAPCGCPAGRLEVWGPKKIRRIKK